MHKLPYIADKKMYAAVMGACSYVRDTGYFNKATSYYADKYNVDVEEVRRYVRIAQGNGQKQAAKRKKREYKWYVVIILRDWYCAGDCGEYESWHWASRRNGNTQHGKLREQQVQRTQKNNVSRRKTVPYTICFRFRTKKIEL